MRKVYLWRADEQCGWTEGRIESWMWRDFLVSFYRRNPSGAVHVLYEVDAAGLVILWHGQQQPS